MSVPTDKGANAGLKVSSLVAGMTAGADSIDDMGLLRHGGTGKLFRARYAPSTLGSFLRAFTFGHVRQLDAVASRFLAGLASRPRCCRRRRRATRLWMSTTRSLKSMAMPSRARATATPECKGLNALLATVSTAGSAPVIAAQRLRKGAANSARGAGKLVTEALAAIRKIGPGAKVLLRADSAFTVTPPSLPR